MNTKIQEPNPFGQLNEDRLTAFETALGYTLPSDYRDYLIGFNGGIPDNTFFWIEEETDGSGIHQLYGLHSAKSSSLDIYIGDDHCGVPSGFLPIGDDGVGNNVIIGLTETNRGLIFFLDHEIHTYNNHESMDGIVKISNSFSSFMSILLPELV